MAETTETINQDKTKSDATSKPAGFVDEGFEPSEAPGCIDTEAVAVKGSKKYVDEDSKSPEYRSDEWRMKNFKVVQCSKRYTHDWTICPFAHPGEKARRRDPKVHNYDGIACPDMKKASYCSRGDACPYAHNVFEYWLHPTRYRTQLCKDGTSCTRHVCFFAHTMQEMRPLVSKTSSPEPKKAHPRDGQSSPDTPLLTGSSDNTTSSASSEQLWSNISEDRLRQSGLLPDDVGPQKAKSGSIDNVIYNLANVKLAMSGDKRNEVIKMLSLLLQEAVEEKQRDLQAPPTSRAQDSDVAGTLRGLNLQQAQTLLAATQRRELGYQVGETGRRFSSDWQRSLQEAMNDPSQMANNHARIGSSKAIGKTNALYTAPAGLEHHHSAAAALPAGLQSEPYNPPEMPSRVFSADLGLPPTYLSQQLNLWQQQGNGDSMAPPNAGHRSSMNMLRGINTEADHTSTLAPAYLDGGFGSSYAGPANPSALRRQPVNLEDALGQPKRESRRPPASAFQNAASQDWNTTPGRVGTDLQWANSSRRTSSDLGVIKEEMLHMNRAQQDFLQRSSLDAYSILGDRSKSYGAFENGLNHLTTPLTYTPQQSSSHNPSALHSAPYDLGLAYASAMDSLPPTGAHQGSKRGTYDRSALLQGWGGMNACDFSTAKY